jgi:2-polyprenyl-3-methyl-5-hydroxy-6-metoxy-1,4-benzoquinol methylase
MIIKIVDKISEINPLHGKKLKKSLKKQDDNFFKASQVFLNRYKELLEKENKTIDYAIDCYLKMIADFNFETIGFLETGRYSSSSFEEVNKRVYADPNIMEYYMHGLLLSQFLFSHHYDVLLYFDKVINQYKSSISNYLEVGGGHGLYISEAIKTIGDNAVYDMVDISQSSLNIAKKMVANEQVNYIHSDIFDYNPTKKYDFITMGEVLEHVEDPISLLQKLGELLTENGRLYITTPTNAPAIDHIYLFKNADEIRQLIKDAGFNIENEFCVYSEDLPPEICEEYKISMLFAGVLTKK